MQNRRWLIWVTSVAQCFAIVYGSFFSLEMWQFLKVDTSAVICDISSGACSPSQLWDFWFCWCWSFLLVWLIGIVIWRVIVWSDALCLSDNLIPRAKETVVHVSKIRECFLCSEGIISSLMYLLEEQFLVVSGLFALFLMHKTSGGKKNWLTLSFGEWLVFFFVFRNSPFCSWSCAVHSVNW